MSATIVQSNNRIPLEASDRANSWKGLSSRWIGKRLAPLVGWLWACATEILSGALAEAE